LTLELLAQGKTQSGVPDVFASSHFHIFVTPFKERHGGSNREVNKDSQV